MTADLHPIHAEPVVGSPSTKLKVRIKGKIGYVEAQRMQRMLMRLIARRPQFVVVDLSEVPLISSRGMGLLAEFRGTIVRQGGRVRLASLQPQVRELFRIAGLDRLFGLDLPEH